ncbi:MAG: hypothetical protein AAFR87_31280 [Bacteroidota bacterium]
MKKSLILFLLLGAISLNAQHRFDGIQINANIPDGWRTVSEDYGLIILGHNSIAGAIIIAEHGYKNEAEIKQNLAEGLQEEGVMLSAETQARKLSNGTYATTYAGYAEGQMVKAPVRLGLSNTWHTGGVMVLALVRKDLYNGSYDRLLEQIIGSVSYRSFASTAKSAEWKEYLGGSKLQSRSGYNTSTSSFDSYAGAGYSSSTSIHFCSNGQFLVQSSSSSYFGGSGVDGDVSSSDSESQGLWSVFSVREQVVVRLLYENGDIEYYPVVYDNGYIISNNSKFTKDDSNVCR